MKTMDHGAVTRPGEGVGIIETGARVRRYCQVGEAMMFACARRFLLLPRYEDKISVAYFVWQHADQVNDWTVRLGELRGGNRGVNVPPGLAALLDAVQEAPSNAAFLAGWRAVVGSLVEAMEAHRERADSSANALEIRLARRHVPELREMLAAAEAFDPGDEADPAWTASLAEALEAAGGVCGEWDGAAPQLERTSGRPVEMAFDDRITASTFESYDDRLKEDVDSLRIKEFQIYFNEFYAAGILATVILDGRDMSMPWDFYHDMAHHFWDEARHAEFGMKRLKELGVEPRSVNMVLFNAAQRMPVLHRVCHLALMLEPYFMTRKQPRVRRYEELGDWRSQLFSDVDWSDEINHVRYGKRWVNYWLEDDARSLEEIKEEVTAMIEKSMGEGNRLPEGQLAPY